MRQQGAPGQVVLSAAEHSVAVHSYWMLVCYLAYTAWPPPPKPPCLHCGGNPGVQNLFMQELSVTHSARMAVRRTHSVQINLFMALSVCEHKWHAHKRACVHTHTHTHTHTRIPTHAHALACTNAYVLHKPHQLLPSIYLSIYLLS